jgi:hypothetical protein
LLHYSKYKIKNFDKEIFFLLLRPMRVVPNKIVCLLLAFMCCDFVFAAPGPPNPEIPPPPGLPVDGWLPALLIISIILGFYKIYSIKKASR